ncbi:MAG: acyl-ACP--UDP-N-acetylglucosamine O-acyltransferase [bacterium]|nr:MAG: acyl-ACP--UDP-N-acetylglucosamine O-acyltransferase [bacterium]
MNIHPTAIVDSGSEIGENVSIGPLTVIQNDVVIGNGSQIGSHVLIHSGTRIGKKCRIFKGAVLGTDPQDLKYTGEKTTLEVGDETTVREFCTLNRGGSHRFKTVIGSQTLLMAYVHIAHDCIIGNHVILANAVNMAGHVIIEDYASVGGMTPIHQFVRIGKHSFIGGGLRVPKDVPPYILAAGEPLGFAGINRVGLSRRGFSSETMLKLRRAYKLIYRSRLNTTQAVNQIKDTMKLTAEIKDIIDFIETSERGIIK